MRPPQTPTVTRRPGKPGGREGGEADLGLLCSPETLSRWHPSMETEAEAIQSSPRFFLVPNIESALRLLEVRFAGVDRRVWSSDYPRDRRYFGLPRAFHLPQENE